MWCISIAKDVRREETLRYERHQPEQTLATEPQINSFLVKGFYSSYTLKQIISMRSGE